MRQKLFWAIFGANLCLLLTSCDDPGGIGNMTVGGILQGASQVTGVSKWQPYQPAIGQVGQAFTDNGEKLAHGTPAQPLSHEQVPMCPESGCPTIEQQQIRSSGQDGQYERIQGNQAFIQSDYKNAVKWWEIATTKGDLAAETALGALYMNGQGVKKNIKKSHELTQDAANKGYLSAKANLGQDYLRGTGVKKDTKKAFRLFLEAAEAGDPIGEYFLGNSYYHGLGVEQNLDEARKWLNMAATNLHPSTAQGNAKRLLAEMDATAKDGDNNGDEDNATN